MTAKDDERLVEKSSAKISASPAASRGLEDKTLLQMNDGRESRAVEDTARNMDEAMLAKIAELRSGWSDSVLPDIKGDPNYHYCWLSTTNQSDPIYRRLRLGYELVKFEELSYLGESHKAQSGEFAGCVSINEMILAKIHVLLYQEIMLINHHEKPMQEEQLLRANLDKDETDSAGRRLNEKFGDGISNLAAPTRRPVFQ